jgi:Tol biopolymer transport system component
LALVAPAPEARAGQSGRDALLAFGLHGETQEQSGAAETVFGARVGLLFSDGSWRLIAEGRTPAYAPNGRVVAISHKRLRRRGAYSSPDGIVIHRLDGTPIRRLTWGLDRDPTWSPSGRRLAFTRTVCVAGKCGDRVFTIGRDGSDKRFLAVGHSASWSPRGKLAYVRGDGWRGGELWLIRPGGSSSRRLPPFGAHDTATEPDWSPRGDRLVFRRDNLRTSGLAVVNADGTHLHWIRRLRDDWLSTPKWAPQGTIAFSASDTDMYTIPAAGGAPTRFFPQPPDDAWCPRCDNDYLVTWFDGFDWAPAPPK